VKLLSLICWCLIVLVPLSLWSQPEPLPAEARGPDKQTLVPPEGPLVQSPEQQRKVATIKAEVARRGVGKKARVRVKLRSKLDLKGCITQIEPESFQVQIDPDGVEPLDAKDRLITVSYADVEKVRGPRSRVASIGAGIGLTVAFVALLAVILLLQYDKYRRSQY
jgi:hypothetical protein